MSKLGPCPWDKSWSAPIKGVPGTWKLFALSPDPVDAQPYAEAQEVKLGTVLPLG